MKRTLANEFFSYTCFSILGMLGVSCYILADTFFISNGLGLNGLTALNLAIPIYNFIHGTGLMLGMGGATKFSICRGQGKQKEMDGIYTQTLFLTALFSLCFVFLGIFFPKWLAVIMGANADVLEMTTTYLRWLLLFAPAFLFNDVFLCFIRNDDCPKLAMIAQLIGSFSNIILDYIFIFPMKMGMFGAIFATGLSPVISILVMTLHWMQRKNTFHVSNIKWRRSVVWQELSLGFPSLLAQISSGIVILLFNAILLHLEGNTGVAAYGVIANLSLIIVAVYTGIGQGMQPLVSRFYGFGKKKMVEKIFGYGIFFTILLSVLLYAGLFVYADFIAAIFNEEHNMKLQLIAVYGIKLYFISNLFVGVNIILSIFFTSIGRAFPAQILTILRGLIIIIVMVFLLSKFFGITGVWMAYPVTEAIAAGIGVFLYKREKKNFVKF